MHIRSSRGIFTSMWLARSWTRPMRSRSSGLVDILSSYLSSPVGSDAPRSSPYEVPASTSLPSESVSVCPKGTPAPSGRRLFWSLRAQRMNRSAIL